MKFYILKNLGNSRNEKYCFTQGYPEGLLGAATALLNGGEVEGGYPDDPKEVTIQLNEDRLNHIKKGDYVSTSTDLVMVSSKVIEELKDHNIEEVSFLPFVLINHKGKIHSEDYHFIVPHTQFDAINEDASDIDRDANGIVIGVDEVILDEKKLGNAPDMFRINDLGLMAFSEPLAEKLENDYTNFVFNEAELE